MARKPKTDPPTTPEPTIHPTGSQQKAPTSMSSFADILDTPMDDIEAPKVTPEGSYMCIVDGPHEQGESSQQKTPYVRFNLKIISAMEDVDPEVFTESKAQGRKLQATFYLTENSTFRLKEFLTQALGISAATLKQGLAEAPGHQVVAFVRHELTRPTDGSEPRVVARTDRYAAA